MKVTLKYGGSSGFISDVHENIELLWPLRDNENPHQQVDSDDVENVDISGRVLLFNPNLVLSVLVESDGKKGGDS